MTGHPELLDLFAATGVKQPEDSLGFLLWRVAHRYQREVDRLLAPLDLTHLQFIILVQTAWLARDGDRVTQAGLGQFSKVHPMQLSSVLKALAEKRLVVRGRCTINARAKEVSLTDRAAALLIRAVPRVIGLQHHFFGDDAGFGADLQSRLRQVVAGWAEDG